MPLLLDAALKADFFRWFCLDPVAAPIAVGGARAWHRFRPRGPAVHDKVELDLLVDAAGQIVEAVLGIDRRWLDDPRGGLFARDIAKSFLGWAIPDPDDLVRGLIACVADLSGAQTPVLIRGPRPKAPPPDTTGGYAVFVGAKRSMSFAVGALEVTLENLVGDLPVGLFAPRKAPNGGSPTDAARWLRIEVCLLEAVPVLAPASTSSLRRILGTAMDAVFPRLKLSKTAAAALALLVPTVVLLVVDLSIQVWPWGSASPSLAVVLGTAAVAFVVANVVGGMNVDRLAWEPRMVNKTRVEHAATFGTMLVGMALLVCSGPWPSVWTPTRVLAVIAAAGFGMLILLAAMD